MTLPKQSARGRKVPRVPKGFRRMKAGDKRPVGYKYFSCNEWQNGWPNLFGDRITKHDSKFGHYIRPQARGREEVSTNFYTAVWFDPKTRPAVKSDADIDGCIWVWQEYFGRDDETDEMKSAGWHLKRNLWREASVGRHCPTRHMLWTHSNLTKPMQPEDQPTSAP